jgi:hypothetical protein
VAEHLDGTGALLRGFLAAPTRPARSGTPASRATPADRGPVASPIAVPDQEMTAASPETMAASQEMQVASQEMRAASADAGEAP